jgi:hypothetical protein
MKILIKITATIVLAVMGYVEFAAAHELVGSIGRKNSKAGGTDIQSVDCFDDGNGVPDHVFVQLSDSKRPRNPARISFQVFLPTTGEVSEVKVLPNDSNTASPGIELAGGVNRYEIHVTKTRSRKKGVESYSGSVHCETAGGVHTGTTEPVPIN